MRKKLYATLFLATSLAALIFVVALNWQTIAYTRWCAHIDHDQSTVVLAKKRDWLPGSKTLILRVSHIEIEALRGEGVRVFDWPRNTRTPTFASF